MHDCLFISWLDSLETAGMTALVEGGVSTLTSEDQDISTPNSQDITRQTSTSLNKKPQDVGDSMTIRNSWHDRLLSDDMLAWAPIPLLNMHDCLFVGWLDNFERAGMTAGIRDGGSARTSTMQDVVNERITALENISQHKFRISNSQV